MPPTPPSWWRRSCTVIAEEGRFAEAEKLFRAALDIGLQLGNKPDSQVVTGARIQLAAALVAQRRWSDALAEYEAVRTALVKEPPVLRRNDQPKHHHRDRRAARRQAEPGADHGPRARSRGAAARSARITTAPPRRTVPCAGAGGDRRCRRRARRVPGRGADAARHRARCGGRAGLRDRRASSASTSCSRAISTSWPTAPRATRMLRSRPSASP